MGGRAVLLRYASLGHALQELYPQHEWDLTKFIKTRFPAGFWNDVNNRRTVLDKIGLQLGVKEVTICLGVLQVTLTLRRCQIGMRFPEATSKVEAVRGCFSFTPPLKRC